MMTNRWCQDNGFHLTVKGCPPVPGAMGTTLRTLQRRLAEAGLTYRPRVDGVRFGKAYRLHSRGARWQVSPVPARLRLLKIAVTVGRHAAMHPAPASQRACGGSNGRIGQMSRRHASIVLVGVFLAAQVFLLRPGAAQTATVDPALLQQLQEVIQQQQEQLERQSEVLKSLQQQVNDLKRTASEAQAEASEAKSTAQQAVDTAKQAVPGAEKLVTSGQERIKLAISGQVNRAVNIEIGRASCRERV